MKILFDHSIQKPLVALTLTCIQGH